MRTENERMNRAACSQEVMLNGVTGSRGSRADARLVVERAHMRFDGEQANDRGRRRGLDNRSVFG